MTACISVKEEQGWEDGKCDALPRLQGNFFFAYFRFSKYEEKNMKNMKKHEKGYKVTFLIFQIFKTWKWEFEFAWSDCPNLIRLSGRLCPWMANKLSFYKLFMLLARIRFFLQNVDEEYQLKIILFLNLIGRVSWYRCKSDIWQRKKSDIFGISSIFAFTWFY